jgi:multiple sugar transport system ATP-binding protein
MAVLELQSITKRFDKHPVINKIDLSVEEGEFVVFVGPSGCGKSTLLRMIAGLEAPSEGDIFIDGQCVNDISASQRGLAMVFQSYALYPHMSVRQNLSFGLENMRTPLAEIEKRVQDVANMLRIDDLLKRKPRQLSGGQRQRVAIGRAIVRNPRIFLFDEPLSNLDAELRVQMRVEIAALHKRLGNTMIYVTHDQVEAMTMADRIIVLNQGMIEQKGAPLSLYNSPANRFVAGFIGAPQMNFLQARVTEFIETGVVVTLEGGERMVASVSNKGLIIGDLIVCGFRPEHIIIGERTKSSLQLEVRHAEQLGGESYLYCELRDKRKITLHLGGQTAIYQGQKIEVFVPPKACHLFHPSDGLAQPHLTSFKE